MKAVDYRIRSCHHSRFPEDRGVCTDTLFRRPDLVRGNAAGIGWLLLLLTALPFGLLRSTPVRAAGVVGTGTPESCSEATLDQALAGGGLVTFDCGAEPVAITLTAEKVITEDMGETIIDGGAVVTLSGGDATRIFNVNEGGSLEVRNLTIANGLAGDGAGILNNGTLSVTNTTFSGSHTSSRNGVGGAISNVHGILTVTNSTFSGNSALGLSGTGGAIFNSGKLTVTNSTFSGNLGVDGGGGIFSSNSRSVIISNSTFTENSADRGGAIANSGIGTVSASNCTIVGNTATWGGGISNNICPPWEHCSAAGTLTIFNSTITNNSAEESAGGLYAPGAVTLANTIIANNTGGGDPDDCGGNEEFTDGGHNLLGDPESACGLTNGLNDDIVGVDPMLDPEGLKYNGGLTQTIALLLGSPAIDAGDPEACADQPVNGLDQRGYVRPGTGSTTCSIGAYEFDSPGPPPCAGDCDENGVVQIHELVTLVNIGLGIADMSRCEAGDRNLDGEISIDEILSAVGCALAGCPLEPMARARASTRAESRRPASAASRLATFQTRVRSGRAAALRGGLRAS